MLTQLRGQRRCKEKWLLLSFYFFFNDTATTEIYTLSLHDALPISGHGLGDAHFAGPCLSHSRSRVPAYRTDRKSTRLNSSHGYISYAVFCLKKKIDRHEFAYSR